MISLVERPIVGRLEKTGLSEHANLDWSEDKNLGEAKELLTNFILMLEAGRGDEFMVDPLTQQPFISR